MVVVASLWPRSSWIVRMSWPRSSRWVANEWRNRILPGQGIGHQDAAPPCGQLWGKSVMRPFAPLPSRTVSPSRPDRSSRCGAPADVSAIPPGTAGSGLAAGVALHGSAGGLQDSCVRATKGRAVARCSIRSHASIQTAPNHGGGMP